MANKPFAVGGMNIVSPKGEALWCKHAEADRKFDADGTLSTSVLFDPADPAFVAFKEKVEALQQKAFDETCETLGAAKASQVKMRPLFTEDYDKDGNPTGKVALKVAMKGVDRRRSEGKQYSITVVDAAKNILDPAPLVGNGSVIRVAAFAFPYYMGTTKEVGISFLWSKMQIIDLVEFAAKGGDDFDEEDGFTSETTDSTFGADDF